MIRGILFNVAPAALLSLSICGAVMAQAANAQTITLRLEDFEKIALDKNPTLAQAQANVRAAQGRAKQAGIYPNPSIGATADEISPGPVIRGGEFGFFVQQEIVLGGKLDKTRRTFEQDVARTQSEAEAQKLRVLNTVRSLFYQTLVAQRKVEVRTRLAGLVQEAVNTSRQLQNVGQADQPDVLEIEVEAQRADLALITARNQHAQIWQQLAAAVGDPSLRITPLAGDVETLPQLEMESALATLLRDSPEIKVAETGIARSEAALRRAEVEKIPNLDVRGGMRYNRELLETGQKPVGLEGFFDVGVRIPLFDRNQGNVDAARAELERSQREIDRIRLSLRSRLAAMFKQYLDARDAAERYRTAILPRAQKAYDLYLTSFRRMAAAYPQALIAQRTLFQLEEEYNDILAMAWHSSIQIQGLLLSGGLETPGDVRGRESGSEATWR